MILYKTTQDKIEDFLYDAYIDGHINHHVENSGIGPYEFWGQRCFDHGADYDVVEIQEPIYAICEIDDQELAEDQIGINYEVYNFYIDEYTSVELDVKVFKSGKYLVFKCEGK